jgi:tetratricopeptide (TPR) repeat protein/TolB-like protein
VTDVAGLKDSLADRFTVEREIGRGGMATVYLARDLRHDRLVALKVLHPEISHALGAERFLREIAIAARLSHPHILPLYDSGEANGSLFFVMPFIEGESLREHLTREVQLPLAEAVRLTIEISEALEYAHEQGIVHRDIKPENILISGAHAIVADFGIARAITQSRDGTLTETGMALGSPKYMSPEQASGDSRLDGRTDIYSLGCVLYEMLVGEAPFTGPTAPIIIAKRFAGPPTSIRKLRPTIPVQIEAATEKALAMLPADRYSNAREFATALAIDASDVTLSSRRSPSTQPRERLRVMLAALTVLLVLGAGALFRTTMGARTISRGPPPAALDTKRVAVAVFENHTGDRSLDPIGTMAADWITSGLMQSGALDVVDVGAVYSRGRDSAGVPTDPLAFARENGAGTVIFGSYDLAADSVVLRASLMDVGSGRLLRSLEPTKSARAAPERGIDLLRQQALTAVAARGSPLVGTGASSAHLPTFAAYQAFVAGQTLIWQENRNSDEALDDFRRAAQLDPSFWIAQIWLASTAADVSECETTDSVARALAPHIGQLAPVERLSLQNVVSRCRGEADAIYHRAVERAQAEPGSSYYKFLLGVQANGASRPRAAVQALLDLDPERDLSWMSARARIYYWSNLAASYHQLDEHEKELQTARDFLKRFPNRPGGIRMEVVALAALGRGDDVLDRLEQLRSMPPSIFSTAITFLNAAMELLAHDGDGGVADQIAQREVIWYRSLSPDDERNITDLLATVQILEFLHRYDEAKSLVDLISSDTTLRSDSLEFIGNFAVLAAWRGDRAESARKVHELAAIKGPYLRGQPTFYRAEVAAILGDSDALPLLRSAIANGTNPQDAHANPAFASLWHSPAFQELLRPRG